MDCGVTLLLGLLGARLQSFHHSVKLRQLNHHVAHHVTSIARVIATARASATSGPGATFNFSRAVTIRVTCTLSARPLPVTAFFTVAAAYPRSTPAPNELASTSRATPRTSASDKSVANPPPKPSSMAVTMVSAES